MCLSCLHTKRRRHGSNNNIAPLLVHTTYSALGFSILQLHVNYNKATHGFEVGMPGKVKSRCVVGHNMLGMPWNSYAKRRLVRASAATSIFRLAWKTTYYNIRVPRFHSLISENIALKDMHYWRQCCWAEVHEWLWLSKAESNKLKLPCRLWTAKYTGLDVN